MTWRELINGFYDARPPRPGIAGKPRFYAAASAGNMVDAESALSAALPGSLRSLLLETNGVMDMMAIDGGDWFDSMGLLWTIEELVERNRYYRAASAEGTFKRDFTNLVFFAGAGTDGILFAFPVEDRICAPRVMVWHPITDELDELALSLDDFLRGWLTSAISVRLWSGAWAGIMTDRSSRSRNCNRRPRSPAPSRPRRHDHGYQSYGILHLLIRHPTIAAIDFFPTAGAAQEFAEAAASRRGAEVHIHALETCDCLRELRDGLRCVAGEDGQGAPDESSIGRGARHLFAFQTKGGAGGDGQERSGLGGMSAPGRGRCGQCGTGAEEVHRRSNELHPQEEGPL
jgi:hypothetical protein